MNTKLKKSKKGGASSHLRPCMVSYCDKHNERLDESPTNRNIRPKYSPNNSTWKHPDVPNLVTLDKKIRKDYYEHNCRHMPSRGPSKASPLKESVTLMPNGEKATDDIQRRIVDRIEKEFGIRCLRMYNHRDEYCDETGTFNWHSHEVWDMYDHKNHRMVTLTRSDCRKWQDIVAEETGMPRGNPAYETRRKWLTAVEFKAMKLEEKLEIVSGELETSFAVKESLEKYNDDLSNQNEDLEKKATELSHLCEDVSDIIEYAHSIEDTVKKGIQEILENNCSLACSVIDFQIEKETLEMHAPSGQLVPYDHFQFVIDLMINNGKKRIVVDQDDYYKSNDPVKRSIARLFFSMDKNTKEVLRAKKKSGKNINLKL